MRAVEVFLTGENQKINDTLLVKHGIELRYSKMNCSAGYIPKNIHVKFSNERVKADEDDINIIDACKSVLSYEKKLVDLQKEYAIWKHPSIKELFDEFNLNTRSSINAVLSARLYNVDYERKQGVLKSAGYDVDSLMMKVVTGVYSKLKIQVYPPEGIKSYKYTLVGGYKSAGQENMFVMPAHSTATIRITDFSNPEPLKVMYIHYDGKDLFSYTQIVESKDDIEYTTHCFENSTYYSLSDITLENKQHVKNFKTSIKKLTSQSRLDHRRKDYESDDYIANNAFTIY